MKRRSISLSIPSVMMAFIIGLSLSACSTSSLSHMNSNDGNKQVTLQAPEKLMNAFMEKLLIEDFRASAKAVMPYVHASNFNAKKTDLDDDLLQFGFKKAHQNARYYQYPISITRVQKLKTTEIGHPSRGTHQFGEEVKYWIAKKSGQAGVPAPLVVFYPADGSAPTISYMNSL